MFDKIPQRYDTNLLDKQCDGSVGGVPLEIEDEYLDIVNSRNHVDMVFDESLLKVEESLPKQTTLSEGQEVTFKPPITGIREQGRHSNHLIVAIRNRINLYSNETGIIEPPFVITTVKPKAVVAIYGKNEESWVTSKFYDEILKRKKSTKIAMTYCEIDKEVRFS